MDAPERFDIDTSEVVAVVDTNVLLDLHSCHDLVHSYDKSGGPETPETTYRRKRAKEGLTLAIYLHETRATTWSVASEPVARMLANVDPNAGDTLEFHYAMLFSNYVLPHVLHGWAPGMPPTPDPAMTGNRADAALVAYAQQHGKPLITNEGISHSGTRNTDKWLLKRARAAGVQIFSPEDFYQGKINVRRAARRFIAAFRRGVWDFVQTMPKPAFVSETVPLIDGYFRFVLLNEKPSA
jgi:hypothetical protein